jgi:hypothetical protein
MDWSQWADENERRLDAEIQRHKDGDCDDDCVYCARQVCPECGSGRWERNGDIETCADCGR